MSTLVRPILEKDLDRVCEMETASFSMPWKREDFVDLMKDSNSEYIVLEADGYVAGAAGYTFNGFEGYINNVVIDEKFRGRGLGKVLMEGLLNIGREKGVTEFTLEVRVGNLPANRLYESLGFVNEGVRKNFYEKPVEDANVLWLRY